MMIIKPVLPLIFVTLLTPVVDAQTARPAPASLAAACGGAWKDAETAAGALRHLDEEGATPAGREKAACLLSAIGETRFDDRDDRYDQLLTTQVVKILVSTYGPNNYDFFASQISAQPKRVRNALRSALMERGHPEAFGDYFAVRRSALASGQSLPASDGTAAVFRPLIERGTCSAALCSARVGETLRIISSNLDILTIELQSAKRVQPLSTSEQERRTVERIRSDADDLLTTIGRLRRGEATIGNVH